MIPPFIKVNNTEVKKEIESANIFKADFSNWKNGILIERNIHLIIFLSILVLALIFLTFGIIKQIKNNKKSR